MRVNAAKVLYTIIAILLLFNMSIFAKSNIDKKKINLSMRMIGHDILFNAGDSTSRVLPINMEKDRYTISFDTKFEFVPDDLIASVNQVMQKTGISNNYLVEVEKCDTKDVVYSYMVGYKPDDSVIPCKIRKQPKDCYIIYISILDSIENKEHVSLNNTKAGYALFDYILWLVIPLLLIGVLFYIKKRREYYKTAIDHDNLATHSDLSPTIQIGEYEFDRLNMSLLYDNIRTELTSKEAELLYLLNSSANITLERGELLKSVWGDDGDYVGRTLDVFISKLRKKIAGDSNLKIINIRGVGYKFIIN
ncbi:MAG: winged helix-turn-helix domain-containing protein [Saprospiraceae bacterium]